MLYSDEDDGNKEKFTRFEKDFNAKSMYLKGYNHFDGYHRIYRIPELLKLLDSLMDIKPKRKLIQCVQNDNKTVSVKEQFMQSKKPDLMAFLFNGIIKIGILLNNSKLIIAGN